MTDSDRRLIKLDDTSLSDDTSLTLADGERDVRGYSVLDTDGQSIGKVAGLYVDTTESKVRFLQVRGGGILGIGDKEMLIPVEAVDRIAEWTVHLRHSRQRVSGAPTYDPSVVPDDMVWTDVYGWYGYAPYWGAAHPAGPPVTMHR